MSWFDELNAALAMRQPYFACIRYATARLSVADEETAKKITTAATNGRDIWLNEEFFRGLAGPERVFVLAHEIVHVMMGHAQLTRKYAQAGVILGLPFSNQLWQVALDAVVNHLLVECGVGKMPAKGVRVSWVDETMSPEEVYRRLYDEEPCTQGEEGSEDGGAGSGGEDVLPATDDAPTQAELKQSIQQAASVAKAAGNLPAGLQKIIDQLVKNQIPWTTELADLLVKMSGGDRPNWRRIKGPRLETLGTIVPKRRQEVMPPVVVAVDTSGSCFSEAPLFLGQAQGLLDLVRPVETHLLMIDAVIEHQAILAPGDSLVEELAKHGAKGGGGTSFEPAFKYADEMEMPPAVVIYLTDLICSFPKERPYPTIWVTDSPSSSAPWGRTLRLR